jgi:hypothetical protein
MSEIQGDNMDWIIFVQNRTQWRVFVKTVTEFDIVIEDIPL